MAGGLNAYGFASGNPANYGDPFGLCPPCTDAERAQIFLGVQRTLEPVQRPLEIAGTLATAPLAGGMGMTGEGVAAIGAASRTGTAATARVLGHYPEYLEAGQRLGAKVFSIPGKIWNAMSEEEQWGANQKFLDRGIRAGADFIMATKREAIRASSTLERQVNYLLDNGYKWSHDVNRLVPK